MPSSNRYREADNFDNIKKQRREEEERLKREKEAEELSESFAKVAEPVEKITDTTADLANAQSGLIDTAHLLSRSLKLIANALTVVPWLATVGQVIAGFAVLTDALVRKSEHASSVIAKTVFAVAMIGLGVAGIVAAAVAVAALTPLLIASAGVESIKRIFELGETIRDYREKSKEDKLEIDEKKQQLYQALSVNDQLFEQFKASRYKNLDEIADKNLRHVVSLDQDIRKKEQALQKRKLEVAVKTHDAFVGGFAFAGTLLLIPPFTPIGVVFLAVTAAYSVFDRVTKFSKGLMGRLFKSKPTSIKEMERDVNEIKEKNANRLMLQAERSVDETPAPSLTESSMALVGHTIPLSVSSTVSSEVKDTSYSAAKTGNGPAPVCAQKKESEDEGEGEKRVRAQKEEDDDGKQPLSHP